MEKPKLVSAPLSKKEICESILMGAAFDFAAAFERKDLPLLQKIYESIGMVASADPEFIRSVKGRQKIAMDQIQADLRLSAAGKSPITR